MQDNNVDTKTLIFNISLRMFAQNGYENVSVRDIAEAVGIKAASIYNHYESKEKILGACYDFYLENRCFARMNREQYEPIIRNGTKEEVIQLVNYRFEEHLSENMILTMVVIYSRIYTDPRAKEIFIGEMDEAMQYLKEVLNFGIEVGRIDPFDVPALSVIILSTRVFAAHSTAVHQDQNSEWHHAQVDFINEFSRIVPFKY